MSTEAPAFIVTLRAEPDPLNRAPAIRLRLALKLLLRACGLRCVKVENAPAPSPEPKEPNP